MSSRINSKEKKFKVLLYYKYVHLENPSEIRDWQYGLCDRLGLKGRILISEEGINGTVAGTKRKIDEYMEQTAKRAEFKDIEWKISWYDKQIFPKLKVKLRDEIVTLGVKKSGKDVELENKANYIEPEELLNLYEKEEDFVILDARNLYEAKIGKFKDAIIPPIDNFRDFPEFVEENLEGYKDKNVVTYCTGGIRCEKASAYLREKGFKKVRQLHGGIHRYYDKTGGKHFEGEMFVFDERLHIPVNDVDPKTISECDFCENKVSRYVDCTEKSCGKLFICCEECTKKNSGLCKDCSSAKSASI